MPPSRRPEKQTLQPRTIRVFRFNQVGFVDNEINPRWNNPVIEHEQRSLLIAQVAEKAVQLGGQLSDISRAKLDKLNLPELEKLMGEVKTAKTAFNVGLMVSQAAIESLQKQQSQ